MNLEVESSSKVVPWWVKNKAPWTGDFFQKMHLRPDDALELRVQRIRQAMVPLYRDGKRRLSVTQALIVTRVYQETEGMHPAIRRALSMKAVFEQIPLALQPDQLLMGTSSSGPHIVDFNPYFLPTTPEEWEANADMDSAIDAAAERYVFPEEDRKAFKEILWPYWRLHAREAFFFNELRTHDPDAWYYLKFGQAARYSPLIGGGQAHTIQEYVIFLRKGMLAVMDEIKAHLAEIDAAYPNGLVDFDRRNLYQAMLITAEGLLAYARRNADYAESLAAEESDADRKAELLEMARICRKVPAYPAESWWEALQAFHFLRLATSMAEGADSHSAGRFDQYMLPFLQRDLDNGLSMEKAQQLLEMLFLKWNETRAYKLKLSVGSAGGGNNDKINIGGIDEQGREMANTLSYMLLEAHAHVHMVDPNLSARLHRNTPDEFLRPVLEVVRLGGGLPILVNDEAIIPSLMNESGVKLEHARHYGDVGCEENLTDPNMTGADMNGRNNSGWINLPKPVELALFNGVNPLNGAQVGPRTGDPRSFTRMDQFVEAVRTQVEYAVHMNALINNVYDYVFSRNYPLVYHDLMHPGPRNSGIDMNAGGCMYNATGCLAVGMANAGDMLAAVDTLIFRQEETTWDELLDALQHNWEGYSELQRKAIAAPKYGADDVYADEWARTLLNMYMDAYEKHPTTHGGHFNVGLISMGNYVPLGHWVGASPDGRKQGDSLSDSTAPSTLAPVVGPTATHRSAARAIDSYRTANGVTFNQRFNATSVMTSREVSKWADLVRDYVDACGMEVQYTVVDGAALRLAQANPGEYRDLLVRVGGYSAVFVELSKEVQDSIIARAEQQF
ncbi:MAG: hypothetical protein GYA17_20620 [Chloroflexi bacterium]|nr:pyruvate formate lyase family protein [Anaerolineaceae bacterium]NMB90771.1 hypothetical protein [Chloroflexota bacterium]